MTHLRLRGSVRVTAAALVAIAVLGGKPEITGGGFVAHVDLSTPAAWCDYYGAERDEETCVLFKGVDERFQARNRFAYVPGTQPEAPDWDGGRAECGGGLHFSPSPRHTLEFAPNAKRFVACRVRLDELVTHPDGSYPEKVKGKRVVECWEVDRDGQRIEQPASTEAAS